MSEPLSHSELSEPIAFTEGELAVLLDAIWMRWRSLAPGVREDARRSYAKLRAAYDALKSRRV